MATTTMTSKGQLTVPKQVREELGLTPGTRVSFTRTTAGDYVLSVRTRSVRDLRGCLSHQGPPVSLEQMDEAIAAGAAESLG
ncbi:AbrB/MazE/SpoVT family DNA-binding domain-containing protein [soil metagenome]|jgi:AbrB family looped-hinge helix DNA binding protein